MPYTAGWESYVLWGAQAQRQVSPLTTMDPAGIVVSEVGGPVTVPAYDRNDGASGVVLAGEGYPAGHVRGRREQSFNLNVQLASKTFLALALRQHDALIAAEPPFGALASCYGLPYFALEFGPDKLYQSDGYGWQAVDCLVNSLSLDFDEGKVVEAGLDIWPICTVPRIAQENVAPPSGAVFTWGHLDITLNGSDVRDACNRVGIRVRHNLRRVGIRGILDDGTGLEWALSRTPRIIVPTKQEIEVLFQFTDNSSLPSTWQWGAVGLSATKPAILGGGTMDVEVNMQRLATHSRPEVRPGNLVTYSATTSARVISIS